MIDMDMDKEWIIEAQNYCAKMMDKYLKHRSREDLLQLYVMMAFSVADLDFDNDSATLFAFIIREIIEENHKQQANKGTA